MKMTFRWYGEGNDTVTLDQIRQIPGVEGIVWSLHDVPAGEEWPMDRILEVKNTLDKYGFNGEVVESVNVHEDIKLGLPTRDKYIENYKKTIEKLAKVGVKVICYNFMPVFDWTRTDLFKPLPDGSTALFYEKAKIDNVDPMVLVNSIASESNGLTMPGWEPERLKHLKEIFKAYENVTVEDLWQNLKYFLEQIIPVAEINDIKMAIHPDDPPWSIFGLPRIITSDENIRKLLNLVDNKYNGLTLCSGSLGSSSDNNIIEMIKEFGDRIHFAHIRNVKRFENGDFIESSHRTCDGSLDITGIVKAYHDIGFNGYVRPDHGRHIWNEKCRPGYGLYDRALGIMYIWGIWDSLQRNNFINNYYRGENNMEDTKVILSKESIKNKALWEKTNIELLNFDYDKMSALTKKNPTWVHFGAGNIFRGFIAMLQQELLNTGKAESGIVAVEGYDYEIVDKIYSPYDDLSLLVIMKLDGSLEKKVVGSIGESLAGDYSRERDWNRLKDIFSNPSLQIASFTITEKGYSVKNLFKEDISDGLEHPISIIAKVASLAYVRYQNGQHPIAFVSMDNCSKNGEKLHDAMETIIKKWTENGLVDKGFLEYINDGKKVSFPWSMIDKITPRPSQSVKDTLEANGFGSTEIVCTNKNTYIAPFVNAEGPQYLVIEDNFPNGRMALEEAGVLLTNRETVERVEKMKVCTCLNPLHTSLAVFGCILGFNLIADEMKDPCLKKLVEKVGYEEGMPVVVNPGILEPKDFIKEVIEVRLPNPYIPDTPQRIASDTSQKVGIRFGETIKSYCEREDLEPKNLKYIPLVIAGWCRYLMGIDDTGNKMELSPDPLLDTLTKYVSGIKLGSKESFKDSLKPILRNEEIFGVNLYDIGLGEKIEAYFNEMISGTGAVRATLEKNLTC